MQIEEVFIRLGLLGFRPRYLANIACTIDVVLTDMANDF